MNHFNIQSDRNGDLFGTTECKLFMNYALLLIDFMDCESILFSYSCDFLLRSMIQNLLIWTDSFTSFIVYNRH